MSFLKTINRRGDILFLSPNITLVDQSKCTVIFMKLQLPGPSPDPLLTVLCVVLYVSRVTKYGISQ